MPSTSSSSRFNGAAVFRRRKPGNLGLAGWILVRCFNGAAVFRRRKPAAITGGVVYGMSASMEPPSFDGGNLAAWQTGQTAPGLQWSRRLSTAETGANGLSQGALSCASMEPPSFDGGNSANSLMISGGMSSLQWSRRLSTAETSATLIRLLHSAIIELQWSRRLSTAETPPLHDSPRGGEDASMEPPSFDGGNSIIL